MDLEVVRILHFDLLQNYILWESNNVNDILILGSGVN